MRKATIAALVVAGITTPLAAAQATDAHLVHDVMAIAHTPSASPATAATSSAPAATPTAAPTVLALGAQGADVTAVQRQLVRVGLMDHAPTGYFGELTQRAVRTAQAGAGLPITGRVDEATRRAIDALPSAAAKTPAGAASPSAGAMTDASSPSPSATSTATRRAASTPSLDERCLTGHVMCVDKTRERLYWVVDGQVIDDFSTRTGREGLATREGSFTVFRMEERSWSKEYHVYMPYSMYFSGGQAVHYSKDFARNGYGVGSHGCVNLRDYSGIAWLYSQVHLGDKVVVYRS